ncbi:MAG: leucine-rich repeat domain-containing protein [Bacteroides sp.]|nr:leucine-rich repeat domain-containing protein [Bacteroides sp.]MCM1379513.1 leucine-rich repeat domain-containing protein [Bacteroides sp.]MCM1445884.1 leucine-rich repeat domain-containing protein [Prevotella sp.]
MTIYKQLILAMALTATAAANAGEVLNLQAGKLSKAGVAADETSLTITGKMNAADFAYIFDNLNALESLDIYGVEIVAYSGAALPYTGLKTSPAATLPDYALTGLINLNDIILPAGLKAIGKGSLSGSGLKELVVPNGVTSIGDYAAMRCESLKSIYIPESVKTIGTRAFAYCPKLTTVQISGTLSSIPEGMFEACGGLRELSLSNLTNCTEIGPWAVAECNGLNALVLPEKSVVFEKGALYGTSGIQTLKLPESLSYIDDNAMSAMSGLSYIDATKLSFIPDLGNNVWSRLNQSEITLVTPDNMVENYKDTPQWNNFKIISQKDWENSSETVASTVADASFNVAVAADAITLTSSLPMGNVAVFDAAGRRIVSATAKNEIEIKTNGWPRGIYLVVTEIGAAKISR